MVDLNDIRVYCDEATDLQFFFQLVTASRQMRNIPRANVTVYPSHLALGLDGAHLMELVREDRPDYIFTYRNRPFLVLEITEHGYTGDNPLQRFTRFATTAEQRVPCVYFTPFARTRDDELDLSADPTTLSKRRINTNVFRGLSRLSEIYEIPMVALEWTVSKHNGKPIKIGPSPSAAQVREVFGQLVDTLDLFIRDFAEPVADGVSIMKDPRICVLQDQMAQLGSASNVLSTAVRIALPGQDLAQLSCYPSNIVDHIPRLGYFFKDKPERLLALRCIQASRVEHVELPCGTTVLSRNPLDELNQVFSSPRFRSSRIGQAYYTGYKWRSDPHCGVAVNIDYLHCRPNNARKAADRDRALVLFYPRVWLSPRSESYEVVQRELLNVDKPGGILHDLFSERYGEREAAVRRERFARISKPIGIWKETTKQARIFRRYCDLIVLSDAILLGNHWKTNFD